MKKILLIIAFAACLLIFGALVHLLYFPISYEKLGIVEKLALKRINQKMERCINSLPKEKQKIINYNDAMDCLNPIEKKFVQRIFNIKPSELGFKGPFFSTKPVGELVALESKTFTYKDNEIKTGINFLPEPVFQDYERMNSDMQKEIEKKLFVESGYRSTGYQAMLFLYYLGDENQYSLIENSKWIAMPGFSEHNSPNTAIDFINQDGIDGESKGQSTEDFEKLPEFKWLQKNASRYNFYLTYPKDNPFGVSYEPWHWHWEQKS